jgi:hypothetical protein
VGRSNGLRVFIEHFVLGGSNLLSVLLDFATCICAIVLKLLEYLKWGWGATF